MKIAQPHERLRSLWGLIDRQHNDLVTERLSGKRILDIGCGYGSLVAQLTEQGFDAEGIDYDEANIHVAQWLWPAAKIRRAEAENLLNYPDHAFDSIVLKDCMHHLVGEGDVNRAFRNFRRILIPRGRIVVLDPNPMLILRIARRLASHVDPEASLDCTLRVLKENAYDIKGVTFYEVLGLPLSGGYVGVRFVPNMKIINCAVASLNRTLSAGINSIGLGSQLCWRYVVHADLHDS
jgi:2-polyprenyl-3-methyl-5-hydroxy-6-metoxy-1,4-benzoquinol methylase